MKRAYPSAAQCTKKKSWKTNNTIAMKNLRNMSYEWNQNPYSTHATKHPLPSNQTAFAVNSHVSRIVNLFTVRISSRLSWQLKMPKKHTPNNLDHEWFDEWATKETRKTLFSSTSWQPGTWIVSLLCGFIKTSIHSLGNNSCRRKKIRIERIKSP